MPSPKYYENFTPIENKKLAKKRKLKRSIKDKERRFKNADPAHKRVLVARDVIDLLFKQKIEPSSTWVEFGIPVGKDFSESDLRDALIDQEMPTCSACALGAMFISTVMRADNYTIHDEVYGFRYGDIESYLSDYFSIQQLVLIEIAYEVGRGGTNPDDYKGEDADCPNIPSYTDQLVAIEFGKAYEYSDGRMIAIMKNIIKNKGEFRPQDEVERVKGIEPSNI